MRGLDDNGGRRRQHHARWNTSGWVVGLIASSPSVYSAETRTAGIFPEKNARPMAPPGACGAGSCGLRARTSLRTKRLIIKLRLESLHARYVTRRSIYLQRLLLQDIFSRHFPGLHSKNPHLFLPVSIYLPPIFIIFFQIFPVLPVGNSAFPFLPIIKTSGVWWNLKTMKLSYHLSISPN